MRAGKTALREYQRLEAPGLWRAAPGAQRREVVVSVGEASLTLTDQSERALAHWSLAALERRNPGKRPAVFAPGADAEEDLEIGDAEMVAAIEKVRRAVDRAKPRPGRVRRRIGLGIAAAALGLAAVWLPDAIIRHTASAAPPAVRAEIGDALLKTVTALAGQPCRSPAGSAALQQMKARLIGQGPGQLLVMPDGVAGARLMPGRIVLMSRALVEDFETPEVAAGHVIAELARAGDQDPLLSLLDSAGIGAAVQVLTTGGISDRALRAYAERLLTTAPPRIGTVRLLAAFEAAGVRATPYAYAIDITGEKTIGLIEADPVTPAEAVPVLTDSDWVALQGICGA